MDIEKTLTVAAPREQVWALLLDPQVMAGAVPGMQSIDVVSPTEYAAVMHQKIAFISARFRLRTRIVEQRAPEYLCAEGTGEDASVASSLKQRTEVFLTPAAEGGTELRIRVSVDLLGRLGTFGLSVMKTKADRLWDEFGANLKARVEAGAALPTAAEPQGTTLPDRQAASALPQAQPLPRPPQPPEKSPQLAQAKPPSASTPPTEAPVAAIDSHAGLQSGGTVARPGGWWSRFWHRTSGAAGSRSIRVEVRQRDRTVSVEWPVEAADQCREWLRELTASGTPLR
ncbi:CoxG family protein [Pseudacidovorax sp. RU35E]|uniref:CoxG family protein n=1 Tax=Pseudacidovorax sp. RU35E TaxID=1907403 RepID=UPI00095520F1|nr:SRPBCC family protein [Pseudacidovorax sp. RU35E]SIQ12615.1 Carbon monoxide dehydrogenase subunit G [Pseudacidovorax sp. RU35E]